MERQPCPYRIFDDVGTAFTMGTVGGSIYQLFTGWRNAPQGERLMGGFKSVSKRSAVYGGQFATWGGLFSTFECLLLKIRKKEDMKNSLISGFFAGSIIAFRGGLGVAVRNGIFGSIFLGVLEGMSFMIGKRQMGKQMQERIPPPPRYGRPYLTAQQRLKEFDFIPKSKSYKEESFDI